MMDKYEFSYKFKRLFGMGGRSVYGLYEYLKKRQISGLEKWHWRRRPEYY